MIHQFLAITQPATLAESQAQRQESQEKEEDDFDRLGKALDEELEEEALVELDATSEGVGEQKSYYESIGRVNSLTAEDGNEEEKEGEEDSDIDDMDDDIELDDDDGDEDDDESDDEDEDDEDMTEEELIRFGRQQRSKKVKELVNKLVDQVSYALM